MEYIIYMEWYIGRKQEMAVKCGAQSLSYSALGSVFFGVLKGNRSTCRKLNTTKGKHASKHLVWLGNQSQVFFDVRQQRFISFHFILLKCGINLQEKLLFTPLIRDTSQYISIKVTIFSDLLNIQHAYDLMTLLWILQDSNSITSYVFKTQRRYESDMIDWKSDHNIDLCKYCICSDEITCIMLGYTKEKIVKTSWKNQQQRGRLLHSTVFATLNPIYTLWKLATLWQRTALASWPYSVVQS